MFFQLSKKKEPLSGLVSFSWRKFQQKILQEMCVCLCVGEQYCTNQDKCRLLTIRIIWGKTEKDLSLPFKGPHNCLPHILSVQPKFLHAHLCELGAKSALRIHVQADSCASTLSSISAKMLWKGLGVSSVAFDCHCF